MPDDSMDCRVAAALRIGDLYVTDLSKEQLIVPLAVEFAAKRNTTLVSVEELARLMMADPDLLHTYENFAFVTRTTALYCNDGQRGCIAIDDSPSPLENYVLGRAEQGFVHHTNYQRTLVDRNDPFISAIIDRATKTLRVVALPEAPARQFSCNLGEASTPTPAPTLASALLGDTLEPFSAFMWKEGRESLQVNTLPEEDVCWRIRGDHVEVRPVIVQCHERIWELSLQPPFTETGYAWGRVQLPRGERPQAFDIRIEDKH